MSTESPTPITQRQPLPPVRCAAWCTEVTGHTEQTHVEDQYCYSSMLGMTSTLHDLAESEPASVYVRKESGEDTPNVVVRTPDDREMRLTADEVGELVERLQHMRWAVRQVARARNAFDVGRDLGRWAPVLASARHRTAHGLGSVGGSASETTPQKRF